MKNNFLIDSTDKKIVAEFKTSKKPNQDFLNNIYQLLTKLYVMFIGKDFKKMPHDFYYNIIDDFNKKYQLSGSVSFEDETLYYDEIKKFYQGEYFMVEGAYVKNTDMIYQQVLYKTRLSKPQFFTTIAIRQWTYNGTLFKEEFLDYTDSNPLILELDSSIFEFSDQSPKKIS